MSIVIFSFEDSPVKVQASETIFNSDGSTEVREMSRYIVSESRLKEPFEEGTLLVSMKAAGFGSKPLKTWIKKLESQFGEKTSGLEDAAFWQDHFHNWKDFKGFNPKLLAIADVLETLQMRLTSYYDDQSFIKTLRANFVDFGPFKDRMYTISYQNIIWYMQEISEDGEWFSWARQWCSWALMFAERKYTYELIGKGYILPSDEIDTAFQKLPSDEVDAATQKLHADEVETACQKLRNDAILYFTKLKVSSDRNHMAHIFSTTISQRVYSRGRMGNKNRALCDYLTEAIDSQKIEDLQAMIDNLADLSKLPASFGALTTALPMQLFFLKNILDLERVNRTAGGQGREPSSESAVQENS